MPFDAIVGKNLLARLNGIITFGESKFMAVNTNALQNTKHDENSEAAS